MTTTPSAVTTGDLDARLAPLPAVSLAEIEAMALLHTRIDRKYVLAPDAVDDVLDRMDGWAALSIDGRRSFRYRSQYFDTADLRSFRGAATGRRRRFKVRTRRYADDTTCALEVKTRGGRGETVKVRLPYDPGDHATITADGCAFIDAHVAGPVGCRLRPVVTTTYDRSTLVDPTDRSRVTIDRGLACAGTTGGPHVLAGHVVLETKSTGAATAVDRLLWDRGIRPARISKFGVAMALDDPSLPANRWNRVLRGAFGWTPATRVGGPARTP